MNEAGGFQQPQGWIIPAKGMMLIFDNEIDWVNALGRCRARREARKAVKGPGTLTYKAEHKQLSYWAS
jgi:hypothetical protein